MYLRAGLVVYRLLERYYSRCPRGWNWKEIHLFSKSLGSLIIKGHNLKSRWNDITHYAQHYSWWASVKKGFITREQLGTILPWQLLVRHQFFVWREGLPRRYVGVWAGQLQPLLFSTRGASSQEAILDRRWIRLNSVTLKAAHSTVGPVWTDCKLSQARSPGRTVQCTGLPGHRHPAQHGHLSQFTVHRLAVQTHTEFCPI